MRDSDSVRNFNDQYQKTEYCSLHSSEMDFQHRAGGKTGGGGVAGFSESNRDRKERLRKLALETIDLAKVPSRLMGIIWKLLSHFFSGSLLYEKPPWYL